MNPDIHVFPTADEAAQAAGKLLSEKLATPEPLLVLFSGGSSLNILKYTETEQVNGRVTISVLDERVSRDPNVNNFINLSQTDFFKQATAQGARFERILHTKEKRHTIITQGIGPDGHTAGIFPQESASFKKLFDDPNRWVVEYDAGNVTPYPNRITVTLPFLRQVDASIVFACGKEKKEALIKTLAKEGSLNQTPARIVHEMKHVDLFTDIPLSR